MPEQNIYRVSGKGVFNVLTQETPNSEGLRRIPTTITTTLCKIRCAPDGSYWVIAADSGYVYKFQNDILSDLNANTGQTNYDCAFSLNGKKLVVVSSGGYISIWDIENNTWTQKSSGTSQSFYVVRRFNKSDNFLLLGNQEIIYLYDLVNDTFTAITVAVGVGSGWIRSCYINSNDTYAYLGYSKRKNITTTGNISILDLSKNSLLATYYNIPSGNPIWFIVKHPLEDYLLIGESSFKVYKFILKQTFTKGEVGVFVYLYQCISRYPYDASYHPEGLYCTVITEGDSYVKQMLVKCTEQIYETIDMPGSWVASLNGIAWHTTGTYCMLCGSLGLLYEYNLKKTGSTVMQPYSVIKELKTSSATTASGNTIAIPVGNLKEGIVFVHVTAHGGTNPTLDIKVQVSDDLDNWVDEGTSFTQITTSPTHAIKKITNFGTYIRLSYTIGGSSPTFTWSANIAGKG